jgi:nucleotide-binding universal stress UspA family protein
VAAGDATVPDVGQGPDCARDVLEARDHSFRKAQALVDRAAASLRAAGFHTVTATPDTDSRHGIIEHATAWNADLIVLGSHGRRGVDRWLIGSVAEAVMRHASCSVQIVRLAPSSSAPSS